jgi:hypothetical protein
MAKLKKLTKADKVKILVMAENGQITADELLDKLTVSVKEIWSSRQIDDSGTMGPWKCAGREDIPYDDPVIRKRKDVELLTVVRGDRNGTLDFTPDIAPGIVVHSTGVPFANRETDVDLGHYIPPVEPVQSSRRNEDPVKKTQQVNQPAPAKQDTYWDFGGGGSGVSLDDVSRIRKGM